MNTSKIEVIAIETNRANYGEDCWDWTIIYLNCKTGEIIKDLTLKGQTDMRNTYSYYDELLSREENEDIKKEIDKILDKAHDNKIIQHAAEAGYNVIKIHLL